MNGIGNILQAVSSAQISGPMQLPMGPTGESGAKATPFAAMFQSMVKETSELDTKASQAVTGMLNGSGVEVHDAMIATQKADMAFELGLQMRNKAVGAYQQMMNMQF